MDVVRFTTSEGRIPNKTGKVREIYDLGNKLLIVTTDRISAYDVVMRQGVPFKGLVLHGLTRHWMTKLEPICHTHFISDNLAEVGEPFTNDRQIFNGRSMVVEKIIPLPIECIVRGYICGSGWKEYQKTGQICGVKLPDGLQMNQGFIQPIFTPSTKATEGHDENITCKQMEGILAAWLMKIRPEIKAGNVFAHDLAGQVYRRSIELYKAAAQILWDAGIILADTKLEFGIDPDWDVLKSNCPTIHLIDECFTPDSSRMWTFDRYKLGTPIISQDKQMLRDWLDGVGWDRKSSPPDLPEDLVTALSRNYLSLYERIVGSPLEVEA